MNEACPEVLSSIYWEELYKEENKLCAKSVCLHGKDMVVEKETGQECHSTKIGELAYTSFAE